MKNLPEDLPDNPTLPGIAMLIGQDQAARISAELGGLKVYIPKNPGEHSPLSAVIGPLDAYAISEIWGGMEIVVPVKLGKRAEAIALLRAGHKVSAIVRQLRCSRGFVYELRADLDKEAQLDMFDGTRSDPVKDAQIDMFTPAPRSGASDGT